MEINYVIQIDISGKLKQSLEGNNYFLCISELATRYTVCYPIATQHSDVIARILAYQYFPAFGYPAIIHTEKAQNLIASAVKRVCVLYGIEQKISIPYHSQSLGCNKRTQHTIMNSVAALITDQTQWDCALPFLWSQHLTIMSTARQAIATTFCILGRQQKLPLLRLLFIAEHKVYNSHDELVDEIEAGTSVAMSNAAKNELEAHSKMKFFYDRDATPLKIKIGDIVRYRRPVVKKGDSTKLSSLYEGPYIVTKIEFDCAVTIAPVYGGDSKKVHA